MLFGGHRGCGKSTELRRLAAKLAGEKRYFVVFIDALVELDVHNLRYSDILLAQAKALVNRLEAENVAVENAFLTRLSDWFSQRVEQYSKTRELAAEIKAGAKAETGLPWLGRLFGELTNTARLNSTYKEEVRTVVRNHFAELADAFNQLIARVNDLVRERGLGRSVLFVIDGTDRLSGDDHIISSCATSTSSGSSSQTSSTAHPSTCSRKWASYSRTSTRSSAFRWSSWGQRARWRRTRPCAIC